MTSTVEHAAIATLNDLAERRRTVVGTIRQLAAFYGLDPAPWLDNPRETTVGTPETKGAQAETKPARRTPARAKGKTARPPDALSEAAIRTALTSGPLKLAEIVERTHTTRTPGTVRRLLEQMVAARDVHVEGKSRATRYHLS